VHPANLRRFSRLWKRQAHPLLFSLDLPALPGQGESGEFKKHVREQLRDIRERWGDRGRVIIPVELDVQVPDKGRTQTDLDNVMRRYIAPALTNELLKPPDGYLHGYRIYRVRSNHENAISVKILAAGAINRFVEWTEETLESGRERLHDELRSF
jgi:Holliday junction resolvase RusA-like endonuclease